MKPKDPSFTRWPLTSLSFAVGLALVTPVVADTPSDSLDSTNLPPMKVLGQSSDGDHLVQSEVQRHQASNLRDLFLLDPAIDVGGGAVNARRLYLNGIEASNLNITLDGARQGRDLHQHRGGAMGFDPFLLKRVEVQSMGGQAGALGGSIQFETVDAQDLLKEDALGARLRAGYSTADSAEQLGLAVFGRLGKHLGVLAQMSGADRENYRTGGGRDVAGTASEDRDYFFKFSLLDLNDHQLRVSLSRHESTGLYARGSNGSDAGYWPDDPTGSSLPMQQEVARNSYAVNHRFQPSQKLIDWQATVYYNENELSYPDDPVKPISTEELGFSLSNTLLWEQNDWSLKIQPGLDYLTEEARTHRLNHTDIDYLDGSASQTTSKNLGLFLHNQLDWRDLTLSFGVRRDDYSAEYGPLTLDGNEISPNFGARYALTSDLDVFARYQEAARASGVIPVGWLGRIHPDTVLQDGQLSAETSVQKEVGVDYRRQGVLLPDDQLNINITYFTTDLEGLIEMPGQGSLPAAWLRNAQPVEINGWRLHLAWKNAELSSQLSYSRRDVERDGDPLAVTRRTAAPSGDQFVWDTRWQATQAWQLGYTLHAVARLDDVPEGEPERAGYAIHGVQVVYQPHVLPDLTINLAVQNLLDKNYADHTSLASTDTGIVAEPGRDIRVGATYDF